MTGCGSTFHEGMATFHGRHSCHQCVAIIARIVNPDVQESFSDRGLIHSKPINLGTLAQSSARASKCAFHHFLIQLYDQVCIKDTKASGTAASQSGDHESAESIYVILATSVTPIAPSGKRKLWSNYVDFIRRPGEEDEMPVPTRWRAVIRLLADNIADIRLDHGHTAVELGRLVTTTQLYDPAFIQDCYQTCVQEHGEDCRNLRPPRSAGPLPQIMPGDLPESMRVIDVIKGAIIELPLSCEYAILSYVWGQTNSLRLTSSNLQQMRTPGCLHQSKVPRTVSHAIIVTRDLGLRYLWVDSVCIIQDSNEDKQDQIHKMDKIYRNATVTIVDGFSSHADGGLWSDAPREQIVGQGGGLTWIAAAPMILDAIALSPWSKRAWTFQEGAFSRRMLFFSDMQVYYSCRNSAWAEDYINRSDGKTQHSECKIDENQHLDMTVDRYRAYPNSLGRFVRQYTNRSLTFEDDILNAAAGVLSSYLNLYDDVPLCGLSAYLLFECSLLWVSATTLRRRQNISGKTGKIQSSWPTWTWAGWVGAVQHKCNDINSRATLKETRLINEWRFEWDYTEGDHEGNSGGTGVLTSCNGELGISSPGYPSQAPLSLIVSKITCGHLRFESISRSFTIASIHWNQIIGSRDIQCQHTGYYRIFDEGCWVGSVHLQHDTAKRVKSQQLTFIVLSESGNDGPEYLMQLPHKPGWIEDDDQVFMPLCDEELFQSGDDEMYNVMLVDVHRTSISELHCERLGIGQIHKGSFDPDSCQKTIFLY